MELLGLVGCLHIEIELLAVLDHESVQALRKRKNKPRSQSRASFEGFSKGIKWMDTWTNL